MTVVVTIAVAVGGLLAGLVIGGVFGTLGTLVIGSTVDYQRGYDACFRDITGRLPEDGETLETVLRATGRTPGVLATDGSGLTGRTSPYGGKTLVEVEHRDGTTENALVD